MLVKEQFSENVIEQVSKILGEAITGGEIERFFRECNIQESPYSGSTKWRRLNASFVANQRIVQNATSICKCIEKILAPVRFLGKEEEFNGCRNAMNMVLSFEGYELDERGKIKSVQKATTLSEAENRANSLLKKLEERGTHPLVFKYCKAELLQDNYFHAILEATKSLFDRLRQETGSTEDGSDLINDVFAWKKPKLLINEHKTESERSEYVGFGYFLKGISSLCRNPTAHTPKIQWAINEADALDLLTLISFVHRRLDSARKTCFTYQND